MPGYRPGYQLRDPRVAVVARGDIDVIAALGFKFLLSLERVEYFFCAQCSVLFRFPREVRRLLCGLIFCRESPDQSFRPQWEGLSANADWWKNTTLLMDRSLFGMVGENKRCFHSSWDKNGSDRDFIYMC